MDCRNDDEKLIDNIKEMIRTSEMYISAQLQVAIAADQRAVGFSALISSMLVASIGGTIAVYLSDKPNAPIIIAGLLCSLVLMLAFLCCVHASRPVKFYFPGSDPNVWNDEDMKKKIIDVLKELGDNSRDYVKDNEKTLGANSVYLRRAQFYTFASPIFGIYGFACAHLNFIFSEAGVAAAVEGAVAAVVAVAVWVRTGPSQGQS